MPAEVAQTSQASARGACPAFLTDTTLKALPRPRPSLPAERPGASPGGPARHPMAPPFGNGTLQTPSSLVPSPDLVASPCHTLKQSSNVLRWTGMCTWNQEGRRAESDRGKLVKARGPDACRSTARRTSANPGRDERARTRLSTSRRTPETKGRGGSRKQGEKHKHVAPAPRPLPPAVPPAMRSSH